MKKIFPLFFIFSFSFFISPAQDYHKTSPELNRRVDSLKKVLATLPALVGTDDDTTRMKLCIDIGDLFERVQPDSALWWYSQAIDSLTDKEIGKYRSRAEFIAIAHKYSGIVTMTSGNYSNAITAFEQAKTIFEKLNDKKGLSTCLNNIGIVYYNKGDFHRAMDYYEKSLLIFEELDYQRGISSCLNNLSLVAMYLGDYSKAEESYEKSLKLKEDIDDQPGISRCLNNLGLVVMYQGDYRAATEYFEKSMKIRENLGDKKGISDCLNSLGMVYKYQGDFPKATGFHEKGLNIEEELGDKKGISGCLTNLGNVFADQGNLPKAQEYYEKSLKLYEELGDEQGMAVNLNNLGIVYKNQGNYNKAEEFYSESLKIKEKAGDKMGISNCLSNLGNLYFYRNFWDKAEEFYEKSLIIDEELGDKKGITSDLNSLGSIYYCKGEYLKAEEYYEKSLRLREEIGVVADLLVSYTNLAKVCIQQNIPDRAVNMYRKALEITTVLLKENFSILSEREKEAYLEKTCSIFNQMAEFSLHYTRLEDMRCDCYNDELLLKGLLLNSSCSMMDVVTNSTDSAITSTFWLLTRQRKQISEQLSTPKDERILNVDSLEKVANETERQLVKLSSAFADQQEQFGYKWQDVQKTLQSGEAAIEFVKIKHTILRSDTLKTDSCSYAALLLKPGDIFPLFIALCNEESLEKLLTRGDENDFDLVGRIYSSKTENTLYGLIWKPMESALAGCNKVYFAPAGQLHQISFAAIPMPSGKLLSDEITLVQLSSTRELIRNSGKPSPSLKQAVVYGGINYETDNTLITELAVAHNMDRAEVSEAITNAGGQDVESAWQYLPGTATEAENVCTLLTSSDMDQKRRGMPRLYKNAQATEESIKSLSGKSPDILHIATHGFTVPLGDKNEAYKVFENSFVQNFNPLFRTGLLFAGANRTWSGGKQIRGIEDGILTAYEAGQLDLSKTSLVVLSACETGLGTVKGSEGVYGLQRAFKGAGVRYIMMSLWSIPDEQTAELMSLFYSKLASGETIRKSFAFAQNEMKKKYAAYYWAGFVLIE